MGVIWGWVLLGRSGECEVRVLFLSLDMITRDGGGDRIPGGSLQWGKRTCAHAVIPPSVPRGPGASQFPGCLLFSRSPRLSCLFPEFSLVQGRIVSGCSELPEDLWVVWAWGVGSGTHV